MKNGTENVSQNSIMLMNTTTVISYGYSYRRLLVKKKPRCDDRWSMFYWCYVDDNIM